MHIYSGHFHPGKMGWRRLEAECRVKGQAIIVDRLHGLIFCLFISFWLLEGYEWDRKEVLWPLRGDHVLFLLVRYFAFFSSQGTVELQCNRNPTLASYSMASFSYRNAIQDDMLVTN